MSTILLSIKPVYVEKILSGEKKVEFRKTGFRRKVKRVVIYSTAPVKMIVGHFEVEFIYGDSVSTVWMAHNEDGGITAKEYAEYYNKPNLKTVHDAIVIGIKNPARIVPLELSVLGMRKPPQSFCYLTDEQGELFF